MVPRFDWGVSTTSLHSRTALYRKDPAQNPANIHRRCPDMRGSGQVMLNSKVVSRVASAPKSLNTVLRK